MYTFPARCFGALASILVASPAAHGFWCLCDNPRNNICYDCWTWEGSPNFVLDGQYFPAGSGLWFELLSSGAEWTGIVGSGLTAITWTVEYEDFTAATQDGVSQITFSPLGSCSSMSGSTWIFGLDSVIVEADVTFNSNCLFASSIPTMETAQSAPTFLSFRAVALHEIGHALGLHHDPDVVSIMNYPPSIFERLLGEEKSGIRHLYPNFGTEVELTVTNAVDLPLGPTTLGMRRVVPPSPLAVAAGGQLTIEYTINSMGTTDPDTLVRFSLGSHVLGERLFPSHTMEGWPLTFIDTYTVPTTVPSGTYTLTVEVDPSGSVSESMEGNNSLANPFPVTVYAQPSPPTGLVASSSPGKITVYWNDNPPNQGVAYYKVWRSILSGACLVAGPNPHTPPSGCIQKAETSSSQ